MGLKRWRKGDGKTNQIYTPSNCVKSLVSKEKMYYCWVGDWSNRNGYWIDAKCAREAFQEQLWHKKDHEQLPKSNNITNCQDMPTGVW